MASFLNLTQGDGDIFVMISHVVSVSGLSGPQGEPIGSIVMLSNGKDLYVDESPSRIIAACLADEILSAAAEA